MMIWIEYLIKHWKSAALVSGGIIVWITIMIVFKGKEASAPQPAVPHIDSFAIDSTQTASIESVESEGTTLRKVKVRVIVPRQTVVGDSAMLIEVVVEDSSDTEVAVNTVEIENKGLTESITIERQEVVPVKPKERALGVIGGVGYVIPDNDVIFHVGLSLRVYAPVYVCASAGWHVDQVVGIVGAAVKIGEIFGLKILAGIAYSTDRQGLVTLSLGG